ncbi:MAG: YidC/Oxa1 family membrane protein insertase [Clostridia bacterium]|nr:YidC/Oxa1 family membrane protein insertase [Clostridia bacterium]
MIEAIASFLGMIIRFIYSLVGNNYFISILLFTLLTKIILFPLYWIQIKSTEKMNRIGPLDKKIREKYKNDKQKQAEELTKLYSENKINPLGGCLPLLIQLPLILAMFMIVKQPLTYVARTPQEDIKTYTQEYLQKEEVSNNEMKEYEIPIAKEKKIMNMQVFKGFNLGDVPSNVFSKDEAKKSSPLSLAIPILTIVFSILSNKMMMKSSTMTDEQKQMQKSMNIMMPLLSASISYTMPLALGIYWLFGNILQIFQQLLTNWIIKKDKEKLALDEGGAIK